MSKLQRGRSGTLQQRLFDLLKSFFDEPLTALAEGALYRAPAQGNANLPVYAWVEQSTGQSVDLWISHDRERDSVGKTAPAYLVRIDQQNQSAMICAMFDAQTHRHYTDEPAGDAGSLSHRAKQALYLRALFWLQAAMHFDEVFGRETIDKRTQPDVESR